MIIDLKKYLFVGPKDELTLFFDRAQELGIVQFLSRTPKRGALLPPDIHAAHEAIKLLRKQPVKKEYTGEYVRREAENLVDRIIEMKKELDRFEDERIYLETELARILPLGEFSMDDITYLQVEGHLFVQFFCIKSKKALSVSLPNELIYITTEYDLDYYLSIAPTKQTFPQMIEVHVEKSLRELNDHLSFVREQMLEIETEIKGFAGHINYLRQYLSEALDDHHLYEAKTGVDYPLDHSLFSIEGWVPENKKRELQELIHDLPIVCEPIAVEEKDRVPTYMENKGINRMGEDLVNIYDVPAAQDRDPSSWVFWSFALFFAFIIGDGGYGLLYLGLALYIKFKFPELKGSARRFYRLMVILSSSCVIWGILTASFFGINFRPDNPISRASLFHYLCEKKAAYHMERGGDVLQEWVQEIPAVATAKTGREFLQLGKKTHKGIEKFIITEKFKDAIFLEVSLLVGVIHLALSLLRYMKRNWASFGWFLALIGGYLYFPIFLKATSLVHFLGLIQPETVEMFGKQLTYSGIGLAVVLALIQKRLGGAIEITISIQLFGDVLSYLRLYALALAGSIMAQTVNDLGRDVGLFFGVLVIIAGHAINILLGIMSGVIHGLRLNFIEWYHYSYIGGGKLFNPLRKITVK